MLAANRTGAIEICISVLYVEWRAKDALTALLVYSIDFERGCCRVVCRPAEDVLQHYYTPFCSYHVTIGERRRKETQPFGSVCSQMVITYC